MARAKRRKQGKKHPLPVRMIKWLLTTALVAVLLGIIAVAGIFWFYGQGLPTIETIGDYQPKQVTRVYSADGELIDLWTDDDLIYRRVVTFDQIPEIMRNAVLAAEDAEFYSHSGLDFAGVLRAIYKNVRKGRMSQGFSSITQQVVKNLILTPERSIRRKIQEVLLAFRLEEHLSKDEILGLYLNEVYFGANRYGVEEASRYFFGKPISEISLPEAALLAGVLPSPARYNPRRHPEAALERREYVLGQMWQKGFIEEAAYRTAMEAPLELSDNSFPHLGTAPHFTQAVRQLLEEELGEEVLLTSGLDIHTTIRLDHQRAAQEALHSALHEYDERHEAYRPVRRIEQSEVDAFRRRLDPDAGVEENEVYEAVVLGVDGDTLSLALGHYDLTLDLRRFPRLNPERELPHERFLLGHVLLITPSLTATPEILDANPNAADFQPAPSAEAAFVAIDPSNRRVLAMVGGYDFRTSWYNRALQSHRPNGSSFKPFIYGAALAAELVTPASRVRDEPTPFRLPGGRSWNPQNSDGEYLGEIPLRTALARSRNVVSVRLLDELGLARAGEFASTAGIETPLTDNLTAALGSTEIPVLELVNAYATIASGGEVNDPILVTHISNANGDVVWRDDYRPEQGMEPEVAYVLTSLMTSVVEDGTARRARALDRPAAGKTGTTNEARDAWFVGFVPQLVAGGWVGFDDYRPLGRREYGGRAALPMWLGYMQVALADEPVEQFEQPEDGVVTRRIDPATGLLAQPDADEFQEEIFIEGTEPTRYAPVRPTGSVDNLLLEGTSNEAPLEEDNRQHYDDF